MSWEVAVLGALFIAAASVAIVRLWFASSELVQGRVYTVRRIAEIIDGDTFDAVVKGRVERIRAVSYDARERGEAGGEGAIDDLRDVLKGSWSITAKYLRDDRNDRRIMQVWVRRRPWSSWRLLGAEMVARSMERNAKGMAETAAPWRGSRARSWNDDG